MLTGAVWSPLRPWANVVSERGSMVGFWWILLVIDEKDRFGKTYAVQRWGWRWFRHQIGNLRALMLWMWCLST